MLVPVTFSPRLVAAACVYHNAAQLVACAARAPPMRISSRQHAALSLSMSSRAFSLSLTSALSASPRRTLLTSSSARARNACFAIRSSGTRPVLARPNNSSRPSRSAVLGGPRRALARSASAAPLTADIAGATQLLRVRAAAEIARTQVRMTDMFRLARNEVKAASSAAGWKTKLVFVIGNVAYGLSLIEYGTTSLLTIRIAACAGCTLTVVYFAMQPAVPWVAVGWNMVFCAILATQIFKLLRAPPPVHLSPDEQAMYARSFEKYEFSPAQYKALLEIGEWREYKDGEVLTRCGDPNGKLLVIHSGTVDLEVSDSKAAIQLGSGSFLGESAFITGLEEKFTARARGPVRVFEWAPEKLDDLLEDDADLQALFTTRMTHCIISKMYNMATDRQGVLDKQWALLSAVLSKGTLTAAEKRQVSAWNRENGVAEEDHWRAVDRLGWTREQYAQGKRV